VIVTAFNVVLPFTPQAFVEGRLLVKIDAKLFQCSFDLQFQYCGIVTCCRRKSVDTELKFLFRFLHEARVSCVASG
jgi:hypothetical protein